MTQLSPVPITRAAVRWSLGHALPRTLLERAAKQGDLHGRMFVATQSSDLAELEPVLEELRTHRPFYKGKFAHVSVDNAAVRALLSNPDAGSAIIPTDPDGRLAKLQAWAMQDAPLGPLTPPSLLVTEPPDHTRYRKLVSRVFSVRAVEKLRERTQQIADDLLDKIDPSSPTDIVSTYCSLLPVTVIAEILGVPEEDREKVLRFGAAAAPSLDLGIPWREFRQVESALREFDEWLTQHLATVRRNPGDHLLSQLVAAQEGGVGLTDEELKSTAGLVLAAGFETTVNLLGNGIVLLAGDHEQRKQLTEREDLWPNAVDEVLRDRPAGAAHRARHHGRHRGGGRPDAARIRDGRPAGRREPRSPGLPGARQVRRDQGERARPRLLLRRAALLPGRCARAHGGRGGAADAVRALPRPPRRARRRTTADPHPAWLREAPRHLEPRTRLTSQDSRAVTSGEV